VNARGGRGEWVVVGWECQRGRSSKRSSSTVKEVSCLVTTMSRGERGGWGWSSRELPIEGGRHCDFPSSSCMRTCRRIVLHGILATGAKTADADVLESRRAFSSGCSRHMIIRMLCDRPDGSSRSVVWETSLRGGACRAHGGDSAQVWETALRGGARRPHRGPGAPKAATATQPTGLAALIAGQGTRFPGGRWPGPYCLPVGLSRCPGVARTGVRPEGAGGVGDVPGSSAPLVPVGGFFAVDSGALPYG